MLVNLITCIAPVNIAVIKYWGKRDESLILPLNDSISVTLSKSNMCAKTTVACSSSFETDKIWLNGKEEDISNPRLQACITQMRKRCKDEKLSLLPLRICSENNFPTAAGLASSAAGFACLVRALSALYGVDGDLTSVARQGSGSACRSLYGGFVQWHSGVKNDGTDSIAVQIAPKEDWPELKAIILVVNNLQKEVPSSSGMKQSVLTSDLLKYRASSLVPDRVLKLTEAIKCKDFCTFAEITMKDSNQFHAICLDTSPPIHYLNATSYKIIHLVHDYNTYYGENRLAYTFDAGSNACLYTLEKDVAEVLNLVKTIFPASDDCVSYIKGSDVPFHPLPKALLESLRISPEPGALQYVISTQVGSGPKILEGSCQHLLSQQGLPL